MPLWLTDRSRYETGLGFCPRARYLEYHLGPSGYGIRASASAMPLIRGIFAHLGTGFLLEILRDHDRLPTDEEIREAVRRAATQYQTVVDARGLQLLDPGDRIDTIIAEQRALLTGLIWTFALELLPWIHAEYRLIDVEREEIAILGCTCGLGDLIGTAEVHESRGCNGIGWMSRADAIAENRSAPGVYTYLEQKTTSQVGEMFETQWETKIQFAAGVLGAEARLGVPIDQSLVLALITGRRASSYNYDTRTSDGPRMQQSVFCYGYKKPSPGPGLVDEWAAQYKYVDEHGRNRNLSKEFQKAPVWEMDRRLTGGLDPAEYWVRWLPSEVRRQQLLIVGPLNKQKAVIEGFKGEVVQHEREWQGKIWRLYDVMQDIERTDGAVGEQDPSLSPDEVWAHPEFQATLNHEVPRSWQCRRYGAHHECQFATLCHFREGWDQPLGGGKYMLRRPHHSPEVDQAVARGIALPLDEGEEAEA